MDTKKADENFERNSNLLLQSWTPTVEDKLQLKLQGQSWKQGVWNKEEIEKLKQNILEYCEDRNIKDPSCIIFTSGKDERKDFYKTIAKDINRPLFSVYRRVVRMYDPKNHIGKYSSNELKKLQDLREQYGNDWQKIGQALGRSAASIKDRCRHLKEDCNTGPWSSVEEDCLCEAVFALSHSLPEENPVNGIPWIQVAQQVLTRSERQCRKKWLSFFNTKRVSAAEWDKEDDVYLINRLSNIEADDDSNINWADLAHSWPRPSIRSHQWLRVKWKKLKSSVDDHLSLNLKDICNHLSIQLSDENGETQYSSLNLADYNLRTDLNNSSGILGVVGIAPASSASIEVNFNLDIGQSSIIIAPACATQIPMYIGCPILNLTGVQLQSSINHIVTNGTTVVLDSDGGEEPAVTTDVMLSGSSLCNQGSPLGFTDKNDEMVNAQTNDTS